MYDKVVNEVVKVIKHSVKTFKDLTSTYQNKAFSTIIDDITQAVQQMPGKVFDLRRIGKRIFKAIGKFVELPPVVIQVKGLITKVTTLFNDIKTDVMELYDVSSLPYLAEVSSLVRFWLRVHAIFFYLPLLYLVGSCHVTVVQVFLGRPWDLLPSTFPSINCSCELCLIRCPIYCNFFVLNCRTISLPVFNLLNTFSLELFSVHDIVNTVRYTHISKASNLNNRYVVIVHVSAP